MIFVTHDVDEAILLGDRVMVMSPDGSAMQYESAVPLPRPRDTDDLTSAAFVGLKRELLAQLHVGNAQASRA